MSKISYVRNHKIAWQAVDDKVVLVSPQNHKIHILSGSGSRIWEFLKHPRGQEELVALVCSEFDVEEQAAQSDMDIFLQDLHAEQLIAERDAVC